MTKYDLRIAGIALALVVVLGLGIGYVVGWLTRPAAEHTPPPPDTEIVFEKEDTRGEAAGVPGYQNIYVNDYADLLDTTAERDITADLQELYRETGVQVLPGAYLSRGTDTGNPGAGYIRVALVAEEQEMQRGLTAIRDCLYAR